MKITLVQEKSITGNFMYSVEVDGKFLTGSCSSNEAEAIEIFENVVANKGKMPNKKTLLTYTINEDEQKENKAD